MRELFSAVLIFGIFLAPGARAEGTNFEEEMMKLRDPFKMPELAHGDTVSELETIPLEKFKMVGVVTGPKHVKAMLIGPDGKIFYVGEKTHIGVRKGTIKKISSRAVFVEEKIVNILGQEEVMVTEIKLVDLNKDKGTLPGGSTPPGAPAMPGGMGQM
jgi:Tfp pilus assembly protein PilP